MAIQPKDQWLDMQIVARRLGISIASVYRLIKSGSLPYSQNGLKKGYRVLDSDLTQFAISRRSVSQTENAP
jgi:excisionase family DNA binding protein